MGTQKGFETTLGALNTPTGTFEKDLSAAMEEGKGAFTKVIGTVGPAIKNAYHDTEKAVGDTFNKTTSLIKEHPIPAVLVGFGIGVAAGFLGRRFQEA